MSAPSEVATPVADQALPPAKQPVGAGFTPVVAIVIAVGVGALGVVGVQESLVRLGWLSGRSWITQILTWTDGRRASFALMLLGVVLALVGLWLLTLVFRRRPRKSVALVAHTGVFLRTADLADVAEAALRGADGVLDLDCRAERRRLKVVVTTIDPTSRNSGLEQRVRELLQPVLNAVERAPRLKVVIRNQELT